MLIRRLTAITTLTWMLLAPLAQATGYNTRRNDTGTGIDGSKVNISYSRLGTNDGCNIIALAAFGPGSQLEVGYYACSPGWLIDGPPCSGGPAIFSESYPASGATCTVIGAPSGANIARSFEVGLTGGSHWKSWAAGVPGSEIDGFAATSTVRAGTWGEQFSGSGACDSSWSAAGQFSGWQIHIGGQWKTVASASQSGTCWNATSVSGGSWNVWH